MESKVISSAEKAGLKVSDMAQSLVGSEIIKLAGEVKALMDQGEKIFNLTIGDFNTKEFPLPKKLKELIQHHYELGNNNYPLSNGVLELRKTLSSYLNENLGLGYSPEEILVSGGGRPLIYAVYQALIDPQDKVVFPVPSWNNNHYTHLSSGVSVMVETKAEDHFMPNLERLAPHLEDATLLALCSPLNPTGTVFKPEDLKAICDRVVEINARRLSADQKPLYVIYDQIYWQLTYGDTAHVDPVNLVPEMRNYTIYIDGLTKAFAATGVRVGWAFGPAPIIAKMKSILGHVGAWSPKAEQMATADFLKDHDAVNQYLVQIRSGLETRLHGFYAGFMRLKNAGFDVDAIAPQAAIYLTIQLNLIGKKTPSGTLLEKTEDITDYVLKAASIAVVPFYAFGASRNSTWYRLSVGTVSISQIDEAIDALEMALKQLS